MDAKQRIAPATAAKPPTSDPCNRASPPRPSAVKPTNPHRIEANLFIIVALRAHANRAVVRASAHVLLAQPLRANLLNSRLGHQSRAEDYQQ